MRRKTDKRDSGSLLADLLRMNPSLDRYVELYPSFRTRISEISKLRDPDILAKAEQLRAMIARRDKDNADWFARRYRLTPAQARIAMHVGNGGSVADYARKSGTSPATVRTHLKAVFVKTGVARQTELVHLLRKGPPQL